MREKLIAKLNNFLELKQNIENETFDVEAEVQAYKASLLAKLEEARNAKIEKIDTYVELLQSLIAEVEAEEETKIPEKEEGSILEQASTEENVKEEI